eukprot:TRINITY_DN1616_c0_g1_i1.p1 TRINITY_DN1616_c0_g1~~TRINITY_DN1616_c0_g1_i1.p1  ORF type:complete len:628 (-),score=187.13 TRINITY_DN1616_c0_g1_i1:390-2273(-)
MARRTAMVWLLMSTTVCMCAHVAQQETVMEIQAATPAMGEGGADAADRATSAEIEAEIAAEERKEHRDQESPDPIQDEQVLSESSDLPPGESQDTVSDEVQREIEREEAAEKQQGQGAVDTLHPEDVDRLSRELKAEKEEATQAAARLSVREHPVKHQASVQGVWKSQEEQAADDNFVDDIDAGRQASALNYAEMIKQQDLKIAELEKLYSEHSHNNWFAPNKNQDSNSDGSSSTGNQTVLEWSCAADPKQAAKIQLSDGGCHAALVAYTSNAPLLTAGCAQEFVPTLASQFAARLAQFSVDLESCRHVSDQSDPELVLATADAQNTAIATLDLQSAQTDPPDSYSANRLLKRADAIKKLASMESELHQNGEVGKNVAESLQHAQEALKRVVEASKLTPSSASGSAVNQTAAGMQKTEWGCQANQTFRGHFMTSVQACLGQATLESDVGIGSVNRLGGVFTLSSRGAALSMSPSCQLEFRVAAVKEFARVVLSLADRVGGCSALKEQGESARLASHALNQHSRTIASDQQMEDLRLLESDPDLKSLSVEYRTAHQALLDAQHALTAEQMLQSPLEAVNQGSLSAMREKATDHLRVRDAMAKVSKQAAKAARLRAAYLHQMVQQRLDL